VGVYRACWIFLDGWFGIALVSVVSPSSSSLLLRQSLPVTVASSGAETDLVFDLIRCLEHGFGAWF
ncbi:hypothetical protein, partial [Pseudomonas viridiflava]|uniref:hypothetical protein n=1 Tax=Pseudomonas viridiflava TaxID=33069 RepID=UPI001980857E